MTETPETGTAAANSLNAVMRTIGASTCSAGSGALLVAFPTNINGHIMPSATAYTAAFAVASTSAIVAGVLVVLRRRAAANVDAAGEHDLACSTS